MHGEGVSTPHVRHKGRQPGNDIDVYLTPLIEGLRKLWEDEVDVWDRYLQKTFRLRAMIFCTINDFSA